jgi:hypothetical protein
MKRIIPILIAILICFGVGCTASSASELNIPYFSKLRDLLSLVEGVEVVEPERKIKTAHYL